MGIIVNKPAADTRFPDLLVQLDVIPPEELIRLPSQAERLQVLRGGPVETKRGFVLHTADFFLESATLPIDDGICLTATLEILRAIAEERFFYDTASAWRQPPAVGSRERLPQACPASRDRNAGSMPILPRAR